MCQVTEPRREEKMRRREKGPADVQPIKHPTTSDHNMCNAHNTHDTHDMYIFMPCCSTQTHMCEQAVALLSRACYVFHLVLSHFTI